MIEIEFYARNVASGIPVGIYWGLLGLFVVGLLVLIWWRGCRQGRCEDESGGMGGRIESELI